MLRLKYLRSGIATVRGICFNSSLLPPYLKHAKAVKTSVQHMLYLQEISIDNFHEAIEVLFYEKDMVSLWQ
ncbi:MAG: hypothetical protein ACTS73_06215 [Arsenophonus sp. NEOnobi-MAG3]